MEHREEELPLILYSSSTHTQEGQCDCDCACALDVPFRLAVQAAPGPWVRQTPTRPVPLDRGWQAYFNPAGPVGVTALNTAAQWVLAAFDDPIPPARVPSHPPEMPLAVIRKAAESLMQVGLLRPIVMPSPVPTKPSTLSAWLHITEACNLNCPYCYVHKRSGTMSAEIGRRAVDQLVRIASRHGYTSLKLKYAGGEPTLNFPVVRAIHVYAARRTAKTGLTLKEVLLTNGVDVTDAMLDFIAQAGMQLMVSLDGGPATHDQVRARPDGGGTYASIASTVERALARGLRPDISITLTALNLEGAPEAVAFALEHELPFNLNFYRECRTVDPASRQCGENFPSPLRPTPDRLVEAVLRIFAVISAHPTYPLPLTGILDRTRLDAPHRYPCSAGRDYLAIDTRGRMAACQMLLEEPWADLTEDDPLAAVRQRGESIFAPVDERPECHACLWHTACSGGCPLMRETILHNWYCQVYRALFPEVVRLEGNRLIAVRSSLPLLS